MASTFRIPGAGRFAQAKSASFSFDGKAYAGIEGDTLASALLANGVHLVGRSFKYHRPRGILSAGTMASMSVLSSMVQRSSSRPT